jgi:hypothetical protein
MFLNYFYNRKLKLYDNYIQKINNCYLNDSCYKKYLDEIEKLNLRNNDLENLKTIGESFKQQKQKINKYWNECDCEYSYTPFYDQTDDYLKLSDKCDIEEIEKILTSHKLANFINYSSSCS